MKSKSLLYEEEQEEIIEKLISALDLDEENSIILYEFDKDYDKQRNIMSLIPKIRKYFTTKNISGINGKKCKRPYMSIIRSLVGKIYNICSSDLRMKVDKKVIRTKKYIFSRREREIASPF